jgi:Protein of unknown function (DUF3592)
MRITFRLFSDAVLLLSTLIPFLFWVGGGVMGLGIMIWSINQIRLDQASQSWPTTPGQIRTSVLRVTPGRGGSQNYWPAITYDYTVTGRLYRSATIIFGQDGPATHAYAQEKVQFYPVGKPVTVSYNPLHPQDACLEPGKLIGQTYLAVGIGAIFCLCSIYGCTRPFKRPVRW